jgi:serine/threonine protein kinase
MSDLTPGDVFAGFEIVEAAGRDELSVVYRAIESTLNRTVALRVMATEVSQDPSFREHFTREAQMAASVDHPNVVTVYRFGESDGQLFMAMRHVEATTLASILADGPMGTDRTVAIISGVAAALDAIHAAGLVHRNVRPVNVLVSAGDDGRERVLLAGFGASQPGTRSSLNSQGRLGGSVAYAAPELLQDRDTTTATDVYSLACVLFACLTGQPPFPRPTHAEAITAQIEARPPSIAAIRPDLPPTLDVLFEYALAKDPAARYQSAGELVRAMRPTLQPDRSTPTPTPTPTPLPAPAPSAVASPPPIIDASDTPTTATAAATSARAHESEPTHVPTPTPTASPSMTPTLPPAGAVAPSRASAAPAAGEGAATDGTVAPLTTTADDAPKPRRSRAALAVAAVFVILVGALGIGIALSRRTTEEIGEAPSMRLKTILFGNGIKAERTWTIDGTNGDHFTAEITLRNIGSTEITHALNEYVPKEIAADASKLTFDPKPNTIVEPDPILRWCVTVAPLGSKTITYGAAIPGGDASGARLKGWADSWSQAIYKLDASKGEQCAKADIKDAIPVNQVTPSEQATEETAGSVPPEAPSSTDTTAPSTTVPLIAGVTTTSTRPPTTNVNPTFPTIPTPTVTSPPVLPPGAPSNPIVSFVSVDTNTSQPYCGGIPQSATVSLSWGAASGATSYDIKVSRYAYTGGPEQLLQANVTTSGATSATSLQMTVPRSDPAQSYYVYEVTAHNSAGAATSRAKVSMPNVVGMCSWTMWQTLRTVGLPPNEDQTVNDPQGHDDNRIYAQTFAAGTILTAGTSCPVRSYKTP